jgi:Transposase DDE domain group 1
MPPLAFWSSSSPSGAQPGMVPALLVSGRRRLCQPGYRHLLPGRTAHFFPQVAQHCQSGASPEASPQSSGRQTSSEQHPGQDRCAPRRPSQEVEPDSAGGGQNRLHRGELFPSIGFVVTNSRLPAGKVLKVYNGRAEIENRSKEGKNARRRDKTSCHRFEANQIGA